ncbi:MAG: hypothetical protein WCB15_19255, partial [Desulfobacterales bacterium]
IYIIAKLEEWILINKNIRQDLQDYPDKKAFGLKVPRCRRKYPLNPVNPVQKRKYNRIHSTVS